MRRRQQQQVRFIAGPRNRDHDGLIRDLIGQEGYGRQREYFGVEDADRAEQLRKGIRQAGRQLGVSMKVFWKECGGCNNGGPDCRYHICYTAYKPDAAKAYRARVQRHARQ